LRIFIDASLLIYLNVKLPPDFADKLDNFWIKLIKNNNELYTNILVLDETLYVSKKKYKVNYADTIDLLENAILPFVKILDIGLNEYQIAIKYMIEYGLKPSDAIHAATMEKHHISYIATEDRHFDRIKWIKRIWI
jgi:predicted nucleic acid-binding protein